VVLIVNNAMVLPFGVIVPVPCATTGIAVYVPVLDNVKLPYIGQKLVGAKEVVPKFTELSTPVDVKVAILAPVVNVRFTALAAVPVPLAPKVNVLATLIAFTVNPPVPVQVNPVAVVILNTVVFTVVCVRWMFPALALPNAIERVVVLLEANIPVVNVTPSASVSDAVSTVLDPSEYVPVTANE